MTAAIDKQARVLLAKAAEDEAVVHLADVPDGPFRFHVPVSYTHLDVYKRQGQYRVLPGKTNADGLPETPARICLGAAGTEHCYTPPSEKYAFGLEPKARIVAKLNGRNLILFTATFSGGGSGKLSNVALLEEQSCDFVNLLPTVQLTDQSEYKLWNLPQLSLIHI